MSETSTATPLLEVRHVSLAYDGHRVVHDVSFAVLPGRMVCLLGPSGCGKTTMLRAIAGFGNEEGMAQIKRTLGGVIGGILLLAFTEAIILTFGLNGGARTPIPVIERTIQILNVILLLLVLIAVAVVVYAGLRMVLSIGEEEVFNAMKSLILRALIGIAVVLISYVAINFVLAVLVG